MATNKTPIFLNTIVGKSTIFNNAAGSTPAIVFSAGADGGSITNIVATSTDTSARILVLTMDDGVTTVQLGEVSVPIGAGTNGSTPAVNVRDLDQLKGLFQNDGSILVGAGCTLRINIKTAVTAAKEVHVYTAGGSYSA